MTSVTFKKLQKRLRRNVGKAIEDYRMIQEGDHIMVCLSGGKDSYTMLDILLSLQKNAPVNFKITAVNLDQKQPNFPANILPEYLTNLGVDFHIIESDTYSIVSEKIPAGNTMCSLCSRLRRGLLYSFAKKWGMTKIALGHHKFDILETFFLNLFFGGQLKAMPPKLKSDNGEHIVIRPLSYCDERDLEKYAQYRQFPIIPCNLCGSQENLQRKAAKMMLLEWEKQYPQRLESIFSAIGKIKPSHLLDRNLFDFNQLENNNNQHNWLIPDSNPINDSYRPIIFYPKKDN